MPSLQPSSVDGRTFGLCLPSHTHGSDSKVIFAHVNNIYWTKYKQLKFRFLAHPAVFGWVLGFVFCVFLFSVGADDIAPTNSFMAIVQGSSNFFTSLFVASWL